MISITEIATRPNNGRLTFRGKMASYPYEDYPFQQGTDCSAGGISPARPDCAGQQFEIERVQSGEYLLKKVTPPTIDMMDWLLSCPEKDWFQPLPSESTDSL